MKTPFSQRYGFKPETPIQINSISESLKNALWTVIWTDFFKSNGFHLFFTMDISFSRFNEHYWTKYLREPIDTVPALGSGEAIRKAIRKKYFELPWDETYDLIEYLADYSASINKPIYSQLNAALEAEHSAYRFVAQILTPITEPDEIEALEAAVTDKAFVAVSAHFKAALNLYSDLNNPDYRNSIKESISAVECMAKIVAKNNKATLSDALKTLEKNGQLHKALKDGFEKLYAYTSDADGIRHAMLAEDNLTQADARYFLLSCTSFVNYLKSKM